MREGSGARRPGGYAASPTNALPFSVTNGLNLGIRRHTIACDLDLPLQQNIWAEAEEVSTAQGGMLMIRKLKSGEYRLYSKNRSGQTGKRRNLGTFRTPQAAEEHERDIQFFKRH